MRVKRRSARLGTSVGAAALALLMSGCERAPTVAAGPRPDPAPPATPGSDVEIARATLARLAAEDRESPGAALLPEKLALTAQLAALTAAPAGSADARVREELLARLHALAGTDAPVRPDRR
jgi:hypothetical protein